VGPAQNYVFPLRRPGCRTPKKGKNSKGCLVQGACKTRSRGISQGRLWAIFLDEDFSAVQDTAAEGFGWGLNGDPRPANPSAQRNEMLGARPPPTTGKHGDVLGGGYGPRRQKERWAQADASQQGELGPGYSMTEPPGRLRTRNGQDTAGERGKAREWVITGEKWSPSAGTRRRQSSRMCKKNTE